MEIALQAFPIEILCKLYVLQDLVSFVHVQIFLVKTSKIWIKQ